MKDKDIKNENMKNENTKSNWEVLSEMSKKAKTARAEKIKTAKTEKEARYWATKSVNWFLLNEVYEVGEAKEFKSFEEWKESGYTVKRGGKAFVIWGQRVEAEKDYFPLRFLFSDLQVFKLKDCRETETQDKEQTRGQEKRQNPNKTPVPTTTKLEESLI